MKRFLVLFGFLAIFTWGCGDKSSSNKSDSMDIQIDPEALNERDEIYNLFVEIDALYQEHPEYFNEIHAEAIPFPNQFSDYKAPNTKLLDHLLTSLFTPEQMESLHNAHATDVNTPIGFYTAVTGAVSTLAPAGSDEAVIQHYHDVLVAFLGSTMLVDQLTNEGLIESYFEQLGFAILKSQLMASGLEGLDFSAMMDME